MSREPDNRRASAGRLLFLKENELRRLLPFFGFYFLLFSMLAVGDGVSLALFVQRVGAERLPEFYGLTAFANFLLVGLYLRFSERLTNIALFRWILGLSIAMFLGAWVLIHSLGDNPGWYGLFFISREISYTIVLMHFGTFLQDYFTRAELNRVLPVVYSAGRLGGIAGGVALGTLSGMLGTMNLVLVYALLGVACLGVLMQLGKTPRIEESPAEKRGAEPLLRLLASSGLLFWFSLSSFLFVICRWVLNFEYNGFFEHYFDSDTDMAAFLGWYTSVAMLGSLLIQLFFINRMVSWMGIKGSYLVYTLLLLVGMGLNLMPMTLNLAVFSRLLETELRTGLRNPISMLITNQFAKHERIRARAWSMGVVTPLGTLASCGLLLWFTHKGWNPWVPMLGLTVSITYFAAMFGLFQSFPDKTAYRFWRKIGLWRQSAKQPARSVKQSG